MMTEFLKGIRVFGVLAFLLILCVSEVIGSQGSYSSRPAGRWQEAMVTGNGSSGVMVYGDPLKEQVIFNHEKLFEPLRDTVVKSPRVAEFLPELRRRMLTGEYVSANDWFYDRCLEKGYPGLLWTDPFHPGFEMKIEMESEGEIKNFGRFTDMRTGEIAVKWSQGNKDFSRRTFVSRPDGVVVQDIRGGSDEKISCRITLSADWLERYRKTDHEDGGFKEPEIEIEEGWLSFRLKYAKTSRGYEGLSRFIVSGGESSVKDGWLEIRDAKRVLILTKLEPLEDFSRSKIEETKKEISKLSGNYETLLKRHAKVHGEMFERVKLELGDEEQRGWSNERLIESQKQMGEGVVNATLLERMFNMGRFTLICSSGELPPNLMGLWTGDARPNWSGDYTLDANINLQVSAVNLSNLPECLKSYANLIKGLVPSWQENAKRLYGCRGVLSGSRTSGRENYHTHHSKGFPGFFWTAGAEWLTLPLIEYYEVSGDREFLENDLYKMVEQIALFYEDFLKVTDENGNVVFVPSYSPENRPAGSSTSAAINATMDIAACKETLSYAIKFSRELGRNEEKIADWQRLLDKLPDYKINEEGALSEWAYKGLKDRYNHRHVSHLYPLWPGHEINPEDTPELFEAALVAAEKRGRGNGSAHGLAHMALIASRLKDAELVYGNLNYMLRNNYLLPCLFTWHNPGRIYNADMLHSLPAVVMEMLVYSRLGEIELLPALSDKFSAGSVKGIKCRGQVTVDDLRWDLENKRIEATLTSAVDQEVTLRYRGGMKTIEIDGEKKDDKEVVEVEFLKDEPVHVMIETL